MSLASYHCSTPGYVFLLWIGMGLDGFSTRNHAYLSDLLEGKWSERDSRFRVISCRGRPYLGRGWQVLPSRIARRDFHTAAVSGCGETQAKMAQCLDVSQYQLWISRRRVCGLPV